MLFDEAKKNLNFSNCYKIGQIIKPHSTSGQCSINFFVDFIKTKQESVFVDINKYLVPFFIDFSNSGFSENSAIIKFNDIDSIDQAKTLNRKSIYIPKKVLKNIDNYITDWENFVVDFDLYSEENAYLGTIASFIDSDKNPLFNVIKNNKDFLIPLNSITLINTDYNSNKLVVEIPEGLFDDDF